MTMYYVFNPLGGKPRVVHNDIHSAIQEAERLCKLENIAFEILEIAGVVRPRVEADVELYK